MNLYQIKFEYLNINNKYYIYHPSTVNRAIMYLVSLC